MKPLGIILSPYGRIPNGWPNEIAFSYGGDGNFLCPYDAQYQTRGEMGWYHDTPLGAAVGVGKMSWWQRMKLRMARKRALSGSIPTDGDLATMFGWMPITSGWVSTANGPYYDHYRPPNNWNPAGGYGPEPGPTSPQSVGFAGYFGDGTLPDTSPPNTVVDPAPVIVSQGATADDVIQALNDHNAKMFTLTVVSTLAVTISALLTALRTSKLLKQDEKLLAAMQK